MLSSSLLPTQLVATPTLLGRCGRFFLPLSYSLFPSSLTCCCSGFLWPVSRNLQQRNNWEGFFFLFLFFALRPPRQAASLRLRTLAAPRGICQGQWQREALRSIPGRVSTVKGRRGLRRPSSISRPSAGFSSLRGQKAEFSADAEIIRCAASGDNWRPDRVALKAFASLTPSQCQHISQCWSWRGGGSDSASGPLSLTRTVMEPSPVALLCAPAGRLCSPADLQPLSLPCAVKWSHLLWLLALLPAANNGIGLIPCRSSWTLSLSKWAPVRRPSLTLTKIYTCCNLAAWWRAKPTGCWRRT